MLFNPFTPSEIASLPEEFYGRRDELLQMERALAKGSVAIQGAIGIGKSSLLARVRLIMEGFNSDHRCHTVLAVGTRDIQTVDDAARLLLDLFVQCDESHKTVKIALPKLIEFESGDICRFFNQGRHLAVLSKLIEERRIPREDLLVLAVDEADKCPVPLARLLRSLSTRVQHSGAKNIRFALAGVTPFYKTMVDEDSGVSRFIYKIITLLPLPDDEAEELVESKLREVAKDAEKQGLPIKIDPSVVARVVQLSGGHPHLLQLLGSHLIEHENEDPDGTLDARDLVDALKTICYEDRAYVYESTLHTMEMEGKLDPFRELLSIASTGYPTRINRVRAHRQVGSDALEWLVSRSVLRLCDDRYGLVDEFLRIRLFLDAVGEEEKGIEDAEGLLLGEGKFTSEQEDWLQRSQPDWNEDMESEDET